MANSDFSGPNYYKRGSIQVWTFIRDQGLNFHLGNAIKYICRAGFKNSKVEDLRKAIHYLQNELDHTSAERKGFQDFIQGREQYESSFTDYATDFDR